MDLQVIELKNIGNLKVHGRTTEERSPLTLFWTGSGIELNVKARELWIEIESDYSLYENWISVICNGAWVSRQMLTKGRLWVCIFRNMNADVVKNIKILKDVQAMAGDNEHCLQIHRVKTDGVFLPVKEKNLKIEFIGDSITSAEGGIGAVIEEDWIPMWFSAVNNYTYLTSKIFNAEYRVISQSGWGVLTSWDNNPMGALPPVYEKICGVVTGENNYKLGATSVYNFNLWQPDVVVINLGTNDYNALNFKKGWSVENLEEFRNGVSSFIEKVRSYNPKAYILWAYGILESSLFNEILDGINYYKTNSGDKRIEGILLPEMTEKTKGSRFHPGVLAHKKASKALAFKIKEIL